MSETIIASIITGLFGIVGGFASGYSYCMKIISKKSQIQKAKDGAIQTQIGDYNGRK